MKDKPKKSPPKISKIEKEVFGKIQKTFGIKVFFGRDQLENYLKEHNLTNK